MTPRWNPFVIGQRKMAVALLWPLLCAETHFPPADSGSPKSTAHRNRLPRRGGAPETAVVRPEAPQNEEFNPAAAPGTNSLIFSKIYAVSIFHDFASTTGEPGFDPLSGHSRPFGQVVRHLSCIFFLPKFNSHKRTSHHPPSPRTLPSSLLAPFPPSRHRRLHTARCGPATPHATRKRTLAARPVRKHEHSQRLYNHA